MDYEELKQQVTSSNWIKVGAKFNDPKLSIFPDDIKAALDTNKYIPNKVYFFNDATHEFKIMSLLKNEKPYFEIYAKKVSMPVQVGNPLGLVSKNFKYTTKFDTRTQWILITLFLIIVGAIFLSGPIIRALGL